MPLETAHALRVDIVGDAAAFDGLRPRWNELLRASAVDCPFLTWEWLHAWWQHLADSRRLHLLTAWRGDQLVALAPLSVSRGRLPWMTGLEFLGTGCAGSDYLDIITRRGGEAESLAAFAECLQSHGRALHLDHTLKAFSNAADLVEPLVAHGWTVNDSPSGECPFAKLQGHTWDTYLDTLAASHRRRFRRYLNTLHKKFDVRLEQAVDNTARHEALESLIRFHEQRWGGRGGSSAFQTASLRAFHHDVTTRALDGGWLRLAMLRLDDAPAAISYCFSHNHRVYLYQHGFDSRFRQFSVGLVMLGLTIKAAIEEGASEFDMLYGLEPYKWLWAQEVRRLSRIDLFPPHIAGRLHHRTLEAERTVRTFARRIFPRKTCDSNVTRAGAAC